jgi:uncharacterized membrane protein
MGGPTPKGVVLESEGDLQKHANTIFIQVVQLKAMPLGNITHMTEEERTQVSLWYEQKTSAPNH